MKPIPWNSAAALLALLLVPSCEGEAEVQAGSTVEKLGEDAAAAWRDVRSATFDERAAAERHLAELLDELEEDLAEVRARARTQGEELGDATEQELARLAERRDEIRRRLAELSEAGAGAWEETRDGLVDAMEELQDGLRNAWDELDS